MMRCPGCQYITMLETRQCPRCARAIGLHLPSLRMLVADADGVDVDGRRWVPCSNRIRGCNWLLADDEGTAQCLSCRMIRRRPDSADELALERLAETAYDQRWLIVQLTELGLPIDSYLDREGGLAFDLLSSRSGNGRVITGHANGVITIDLAESLDDHREALRVQLGEPYRTMLGHFRHEVGHYYQWILVENGPAIDDCRALFGDERESYTDAMDRHYRNGAPANWAAAFISEYATMHPWEDFAETFAHYLHITDTLSTAAAAGLKLQSDRVDGLVDGDVEPRASYLGSPAHEMLDDWHWLSLLFNRANRAMGKGDMYPFVIVPTVARKLAFVHRVVQDVNDRPNRDGVTLQLSTTVQR